VEHLDHLANHRRVGEHIQFLKGALEGRELLIVAVGVHNDLIG